MKYKIWEMRINTSKVCMVKSSFGGLQTPVDRAIFIFFKFLQRTCIHTHPWFLLSKLWLFETDFNKHDIDIFINLAKIVCYGRHWDESCNEWRLLLIIYFDSNFPYAKLRPYDDYKNMSTLNAYFGILSTSHTGLTTHSKNRATWLLSLLT
jgi:hypothetical protein